MPEFSPDEIVNREHIAPDKTGDNIAAKKTANYVWNSSTSQWERSTANSSLATIATNTSKDGSALTFYSAKITTTAGASITPTSGKAITIHKVLITNSANNSTFVDVSLSSTSLGTILQGENITSSWLVTLATDEALTIATDVDGTVYVNIQYTEA